MTEKEILKVKNNVIANVKQGRLQVAFATLVDWASDLSVWELTDEIKRLEESYLMMLKYAVDGINDPARDEVYDSIVTSLYQLIDRLQRETLKQESSSKVYFSTLRLIEMQRTAKITQLISQYSDACSQASLYNIITDSNNDNSKIRETALNKERLECDVFNRIWTAYPLTSEDIKAIDDAIESEVLPIHFKQLLVSALMLGAIDYYDSSRLKLLLKIYQQSDENLSLTALCAAMLVMSVHSWCISDRKILNQLLCLQEMSHWNKDVTTVFLQLIRTCDTERISRKMQDELLPEMMKFRPDGKNKFNPNDLSSIDINSIEENPEWQEMLENSGIANKIKELTELQQEGSDVFMSTFAHLKSYSFFSTVSNWFLPFHIEHTCVADSLGSDSVLGEIIASSPHLCNSDKYSFALSLRAVPEVQRTMMMSQLDAQNIDITQMRNTSFIAEYKQRENIINKYVQDLYRFFKLYRNKADFTNPFASVACLLNISIFKPQLCNADTLTLLAEFYFKRKYYKEAYDVFVLLSAIIPPSAQIFQKMGYSMQQLGDIAQALRYYEQAELLDGQSVWTLRHLATCSKMLKNDSAALEYYLRLESLLPDDISVALNIGHCYLAVNNISEALHYYYKAEFIDESSTRAWRPVAWCLLLNKDFKQSQLYYNRIIANDATATDYLNLGHVYMAQGNIADAVKAYQESIKLADGSTDTYLKSMECDKTTLQLIGVDIESLSLVIDATLYNIGR